MELAGTTNVAIADPHPAVGAALVEMIESRPGFEVTGCVSDAAALIELLAKRPSELVLVDQELADPVRRMAGGAGTLLEHVRAGHPSLAIAVLAMRDDPLLEARSLASGASAFLPKERIGELLGLTLAPKALPAGATTYESDGH